MKIMYIFLSIYSVARNSPLRFGATALGQQVDMWLRLRLRPNLLRFAPQTSHIPKTLGDIDKME